MQWETLAREQRKIYEDALESETPVIRRRLVLAFYCCVESPLRYVWRVHYIEAAKSHQGRPLKRVPLICYAERERRTVVNIFNCCNCPRVWCGARMW